MKKQLLFFSNEKLISQLINLRVKEAKKNHDNLISGSYANSKSEIKKGNVIYSLMPARNTWVKLGQQRRTNTPILNSVNANKIRLRYTIERDKKLKRKPEYYKKLIQYIKQLRKRVFNYQEFKLAEPIVIPILKSEKEGTLRPLCSYTVDDNIILKEINSYLTRKFDVLFYDCSYAFRAKNKNNEIPTHHDTITQILQYRKLHQNETIYVAECDLQKFFDTINHDIIKQSFYSAINDSRAHIPPRFKTILTKVLDEYLDSYNFRKNVLGYQNDEKFKKRYGNKYFKWIKDEILRNEYGKNFESVELGIPQGGPLSGLIANLVQNKVDEAIVSLKDPDLLYLRYCDDMIMLHTNLDKLNKAFKLYQQKIHENKLFIHEPIDLNNSWYTKKIYSVKSKNPYRWGAADRKFIPWISFVGYQINFNGEVRIRKSSIKKEQSKQYKIVLDVINSIKKYGINKTVPEIKESVQKRLVGMSVGRITLYDMNMNSTLCWSYGFKNLEKNKYSLQQMRQLDKSRKQAYGVLCKYLNTLPVNDNKIEKKECLPPKQIIYSGKPFSYYYWLENKKETEKNEKDRERIHSEI